MSRSWSIGLMFGGVIVAWYLVVLVFIRPLLHHPQRTLPVLARKNLEALAATASPGAADVHNRLRRFTWHDQWNSYEVRIEPENGKEGLGFLVAEPKRKLVEMPYWRQALLLDFYKYEYPTIRVYVPNEKGGPPY